MLVTSRQTQRWIIPKGWPQKGKAPYHSAAREAFEEAGVVGAVGRRSVGSFPYEKQWPEKEQREIKWLSANEAAESVQEPMLSEIIRRLAQKLIGPH
jgi:8-oxo-dGTP pyrophosphatase MutT (NUDIX family)